MKEKIKDNLILYAPVYLVCLLLLGWIGVSLFENYYLISLYPIYIAVVLTGLGMIKYQEREIHQTPLYALELEAKLFPRFIVLAIVTISVLLVSKLIAWELLIIPILIILVTLIRLSIVKKSLKERNELQKIKPN